jgi:hypothetical protein
MAIAHAGYESLPDNARPLSEPDEVMYEDKFVKLTASSLFLKHLHLLSATTKFDLTDIQALVRAVDYFAGHLSSRPLSFARRCLGVKLWGLSANGILASPEQPVAASGLSLIARRANRSSLSVR